MAKNSLKGLMLTKIGNHRTRQDLLGAATFPGLTIDNLTTTPVAPSSGTVEQQIAGLSQQMDALNSQRQSQVQQAIQPAASSSGTASGSSTATGSGLSLSGVTGAASSLLGGGFGLSPIIEGLLSLFGGGSGTPAAQTPLVPFIMPASVQYAAGVSGPAAPEVTVDYGQSGQVRSLAQQGSPAAGNGVQASPTVHVNVTAMDSRSFLDHSDDIAAAVRSALLNSNSLKDVISSL